MLQLYESPRDLRLLKAWLDAAEGARPLCQNTNALDRRVNQQRLAWILQVLAGR